MWKKVYFNTLSVEHSGVKSTLVKMPNSSEYAGYKFWHPTKLIRPAGGNGYHATLSYTDEFVFKLFKGVKNKTTLEINAEEFEHAFGKCNDTIKHSDTYDKESYLIIDEPEKITADVVINEELRK